MEDLFIVVRDFIWGPWFLLWLLPLAGAFLMVRLAAFPIVNAAAAFRTLWRGRKSSGPGEVTSFNALMTALSATIGTGNIVGVATAIGIGGPGALFWMWCTALLGMATKYAEAVCAVHYRDCDINGHNVGGPMYYIKNGLGKKWAWLGTAFAFFGCMAGFGIGNTVQAHSVADALYGNWHIPKVATALALMVLVFVVLIGGVKRIAELAGKLVPAMGLLYVFCGIAVLITVADRVPDAFALIINSAFNGTAAAGGFAGAGIALAIQFGVARGVFSNEAGLGSAPIAHAAAQTKSPVEQGVIAMLGTFIDTIVVCTITGLVIVATGVWSGVAKGSQMSQAAFAVGIPYGEVVITLAIVLFAFTTLLGWSYYGERCAQFLFGPRVIVPFRVVWVLAIYFGATAKLHFIWIVADVLNGLMAIPNLIALVLLSGIVVKLTKEYRREKQH
ncbi:sodium:alanine symporter family protein [Gilvimarinus agarilyticus]|uniref:alanine/glycine:cation symporter family protein n=1 Tax=unclassified Gilvimarinus TaxID=2642066 RepID=UPI001C08072A|nr:MULTISPECIES: sodium:alanine symporter family protein [unclassified Gilvimarinus]MBU2887032.1 sodium:alanine symporter family protein [Gilvimarinus agarilyticus]MDO6571692.1 sodium:alanine symporter family protein [Gilvimarinus sp. 2_MG-2023]MDO6745764.1 sodium:alanine symporter family protein [Gilvimarinus sp. 1_MG-2023]